MASQMFDIAPRPLDPPKIDTCLLPWFGCDLDEYLPFEIDGEICVSGLARLHFHNLKVGSIFEVGTANAARATTTI